MSQIGQMCSSLIDLISIIMHAPNSPVVPYRPYYDIHAPNELLEYNTSDRAMSLGKKSRLMVFRLGELLSGLTVDYYQCNILI